MRILALYPYVPWPLNRGAYHRAYHLLKGLAAEHEVDLLALAEKGDGTQYSGKLEQFCRRVQILKFEHPEWEKLFPRRLFNPLPATVAHWSSEGIARGIDRVLSGSEYDAVHVLDLVLTQYVLDREIPLVLDRTRVDLQYQWMEHKRVSSSLKSRLLAYENFLKLIRYERVVARRCALQVVCGPDDEEFTRKYISRIVPMRVIPNGVDLEYFHPDACAVERDPEPTIIFCGAMDYMPNVDALRWYFSEMHDSLGALIPALKVLIVGKDPTAEIRAYAEKPGVTVTGAVPDVRPYYKRAWTQIVPLRIGGGTRLKIVESLGIGTPVVSTRIGAQGLGLRHEYDILYGETPAEFVKETARALADAALRANLERNGRESVTARLSWPKLGADLVRAYSDHFEPSTTAMAQPRSSESAVVAMQ